VGQRARFTLSHLCRHELAGPRGQGFLYAPFSLFFFAIGAHARARCLLRCRGIEREERELNKQAEKLKSDIRKSAKEQVGCAVNLHTPLALTCMRIHWLTN
jgi:hypothetical protein